MKIYSSLLDYKNRDFYPFHMPGHKRNFKNGIDNPYDIDITEIDGFDNLHNPQDMIKESMENIKNIYGSLKSYYLVNGSSVGILSSISAICKKGDKIIMARNCHKAVYNIVKLLELVPIYIYPNIIENFDIIGDISEDKLKKILEIESNVKAVILTSPTYDGVVSNVKNIARVVHKFNIPLVVDEAHGAHFNFCDKFPESAVKLGADVVIQSLHKTLPAFTQTAIIHICSDRIDLNKMEYFLSLYQTSSPSYIMLAGMEYCINYCNDNKEKFLEYNKMLLEYRTKFSKLNNIKLFNKLDCYDYDNSKLLFSTKNTNISGKQLYKILLEKYHLQFEMASKNYILGMTSVCDKKEGFERLYNALFEIDLRLISGYLDDDIKLYQGSLKMALKPSKVDNFEVKKTKLVDSENLISSRNIYVYPPGIPIIVSGERFNKNIIELLLYYIDKGFEVIGIYNKEVITVIE